MLGDYAVPAEARGVRVSIASLCRWKEYPIEAPPVPVDPPWGAAVTAGNEQTTSGTWQLMKHSILRRDPTYPWAATYRAIASPESNGG